MPNALDRTFSVLTSTSNTHAVDVLIHALDSIDEAVQSRATTALLKRNSTRGQTEVIRRLDSLGPEARIAIEKQTKRLSAALKQSLLHGDAELRRNGLEVIRATENYDQIPTLLQMLESDDNDLCDETIGTLRELTDRLYEHGRSSGSTTSNGKYLRNASQIRHRVLTELDQTVSHFDQMVHADDVVEAILVLGDPANFAVQKVLLQSGPGCRDAAGKLLVTSRHPGVMQLILDFMSQNYPPAKALEAVQERDDAEFVAHLLRWFPQQLSATQQKNFRQVKSIGWLDPQTTSLDTLPGNLQGPLAGFIRATGLPENRKIEVQEWLVRHGSPEGRLAAAQVLGTLDKQEVCGILIGSLESEDEDVQAWATGQLREQHIPNALAMLIDRLDSSSEVVQKTAREELDSFDLDLMLNLYEKLDSTVCRQAGRLIAKIDPDCISKLTQHLRAPIRSRRLRAARATLAMGLQTQVFPALAAMLTDDDTMIRRTAAEILGHVATAEAYEVLLSVQDDPSPRVREATQASIDQLKQSELQAAVTR